MLCLPDSGGWSSSASWRIWKLALAMAASSCLKPDGFRRSVLFISSMMAVVGQNLGQASAHHSSESIDLWNAERLNPLGLARCTTQTARICES